MAFLLLAANARDDTLLFFQQQQRRQQEKVRRSRARAANETSNNPQAKDDGTQREDDSCHSLPCNWKSGSRTQHHQHHHKSPLNSFSSLKSYFTLPLRATNHSLRRSSSHNRDDHSTWRQRRRVRQSAKEIQSAVEERLQKAPFLASCQHHDSDSGSLPSHHSSKSIDSIDLPIVSLDDIRIRYWLGRGGFCDVFEVDPLEDICNGDTKVVFKHLRSTLLPPPPSVFHHPTHSNHTNNFCLGAIDLRMESLYLSQISHPNIIHLHGVVQPPHGLPYSDGHYDGFGLLLEPLADTLDQRLDNWRRETMGNDQDESCRTEEDACLPPDHHLERALDYASQVASALHYLHERRLVLCDAKPSNVGFTKDDTVKLFDLGLCRELPALEEQGERDDPHRLYTLPVAGTPFYLPPEALTMHKYNCLTDVYSWALVLYEMVTLSKPFEGMTREEHFQRVAQEGERPPLGRVPPVLHSLLKHAWDAEVAKRWTIQQMGQELERVRLELGLLNTTTPKSSNEKKQKHSRKSSMDSLLNGRFHQKQQGDAELLESEYSTSLPVSMSTEHFESYFADYHHELSNKTTWKAALPVVDKIFKTSVEGPSSVSQRASE